MKNDKKVELKSLTKEDLKSKLLKINEDLARFSLDLRMGKVKNVRVAKSLRYERVFIVNLLANK